MKAVQDQADGAMNVTASMTAQMDASSKRLAETYTAFVENLSGGFSRAMGLFNDNVTGALNAMNERLEEIRRLNAVRREAFAAALAAIGVKAHPSDANFLLCDFGRDMRPEIERLRERGILVRPCGMFPGLTHGHVRLCVRTEGENGRLVAALKGTGHD